MEHVQIKKPLKRRKANRSPAGNLLNFLVLLLFGAFMALPLFYVVSNAFKPLDELFLFPPRILMQNPTLGNFQSLKFLFTESYVVFWRYLYNTVFITVVTTVGHVFISSMAAYVLEKRVFPGRKAFFNVVVLALMFSPAVTGIPNYIIMGRLGWIDSYFALVVPALAAPLGLYLMKQFMVNIPDQILEAAKVDGAREFTVFFRIVMPNLKPAWLTLTIFSFQSLWGITGGAFIFSEQKKLLPYALSQIMSGGIARLGSGAAVSLLMLLVPIAVFVISQANILQTMAFSGMKD